MHPGFQKVFAFVEKAVAQDLPEGRYEIDGDAVFAMVQSYVTKPSEAGSFEAYEKYIDLQFVMSGVETIETLDIAKAAVKTPYDETKDAAFFHSSEKVSIMVLEAGEYGLFFPHDTHKPGRNFAEKVVPVKKIVVKMKV